MSEKELLLERLDEMIRLLRLNVTQRPYIDQTYAVSASQGFFLDYKDRKHLYIFSPVNLSLSIGIVGSLTVPANTWTDISFPANLQIFALGQTAAVLVLVRASDAIIESVSNFSINVSNVEQAILDGQGFSCSTDLVPANVANMAGEIFFPASNPKNIIIWSVRASYNNASAYLLARMTSARDANIEAGTPCASNILNMRSGGPTDVTGFTMAYNSGVTAPAASASSIPLDIQNTAQGSTVDLFAPGEFRFIPAGTAAGIAIYHHTGAVGFWGLTYRWIAF